MAVAALPHALAGWPALDQQLRAAALDPGVIRALAIGWVFGSVAMVGMGLAVLFAAPELPRSPWATRVCASVGLSYLVFGVAAFAYRFPNPHFLLFVVLGALVTVPALLGGGRARTGA